MPFSNLLRIILSLLLPCDVEVPLGPEEAHVHLHLGVQVAHADLGGQDNF